MVRGRPPAHTREQVLDAAIRVADAEGLAAVSIRRVATEIGAGAMSLYTYVPDKDRLVDLMVDRVGGMVPPIEVTGDWHADLLALATAQRDSMRAHPWLPAALPGRRISGRHMLAYLDQGVAALAPTGLDGPTKMELIGLLTGLVAAFVTNETTAAPTQDQTDAIVAATGSGDFPHLAAVLAQGGGRPTTFERTISWLIRGLVTQADPPA